MIETVSAIIENENGKILTLKRAGHKKYYPGKWNILSGKIEKGESAEAAVRREVFEELSIAACVILGVRSPRVHHEPDGSVWNIYVAKCAIRGKISLNDENVEYRWVTIEEFLKLDHTSLAVDDLKEFYSLPISSPGSGED